MPTRRTTPPISAGRSSSRGVGSLIIVDNVVREGGVIDPSRHDAHIEGVRDFYATAAAEPRVSMTAIQTVGAKGYDGFAIGLVTAAP